MNLREWLNRNPSVGVVALVLILAALMLSIWQSASSRTPRSGPKLAYFYNLETQELFVSDNAQVAPILDGQGVRAYVFSCGQCSDKSARFVGWLEKYSPEAIQALQNRASQKDADWKTAQLIEDGRLIASSDTQNADVQWQQHRSPQADQITRAAIGQCEDQQQRAVQCIPRTRESP